MTRIFGLLVLAMSLALLPACGGGGSPAPLPNPTPQPLPTVRLQDVASGFVNPLGMESQPDGRVFIVEQRGTIQIVRGSIVNASPFLDVRGRAGFTTGGETGLLGLAFHPQYAQNLRLYVNYTRTISGQLQTVIAEFTASALLPDTVDPATERIVLIVNQPFGNHNGGQLSFGPDGFLYIALGDGGSGGDPDNRAQNPNDLLGKILRIDVNDTSVAYRIPADNPFSAGGGRGEIWALGLRNPWRFSFDPPTGRLFAGDVGQGAREEIDLITRGANYGWRVMEGSICFNPATGCNQTGLTLPIHDYPRADGGTVIGGFVYRGAALPGLVGFYVFGDFITGRVWALRESGGTWTRFDLLNTGRPISSFGRDAQGELYLLDYSAGTLHRIVAA